MRTAIAILALSVASYGQEFYPAGVVPTTPKAAALGPREPRLLFFMADWCGPCHAGMNQFIPWCKPSGYVIDETDRAHIQLVNVDKRPDLVKKYGVVSIPAVVLVDGEGDHKPVTFTTKEAMVGLFFQKRAKSLSAQDLSRVGCELRIDFTNTGNAMFSPGSGINTEYGVVTCWHCVENHPFEVECDGEVARGTVIARDVGSDVALISVPWKKPHPTVGISEAVAAGELKCIARGRDGFIGIEDYKILERRWSFDGEKILVDKPFFAGQSGGGMVDDRGDLAGIISGNHIVSKPFRGLVIPAEAIRRVIPGNVTPKSVSLSTHNVPAEAESTPYAEIVRVLALLPRPDKGFVEFGCGGDARWCQAAVEKWRCQAMGIEIDHDRAVEARQRVRMAGLEKFITIVECDATKLDAGADVGAAYLYQETLDKLRPKLEKLNAFVSYMHRPQLPVYQNGKCWIYNRSIPAQRVAIWEGQQYTGRVCSDPNCRMCASIAAQLGM
jgi:thiol-disulfide isomerase/thioredoxin